MSKAPRNALVKIFACRPSKHPTGLLGDDDGPSFTELAESRQFDYICEILDDPAVNHEAWLWTPRELYATPLHCLLCQKNPTAEVVSKTLQVLWYADLMVDAEGRTPLHCAVVHRHSAAVVCLLLGDELSTAASVQDTTAEGRYPLHYAVLCANSNNKKRSNKKAVEAATEHSLQVIQLLLEACPEAVAGRDLQGNTPLDLAEKATASSNMDPRILATLQYAAKILARSSIQQETSNNIAIVKGKTGSSGQESVTTSTELSDDFLMELPLRQVNIVELLDDEGGDNDDDLSSVGEGGVSSHPFKKRTTTSVFRYVQVDV